VLVTGDTASVDEAVRVGSVSDDLSDMVFLPDIHPVVIDAVIGNASAAAVGDEALGIVETRTVAAAIDAADAGVKAAEVDLGVIRLADGLGGKGYLLFSGVVAEVEAALDAASSRAEGHGTLLRSDLIAQLHGEMAANLRGDVHFLTRVSAGT
jgi:microcompartment protein CcmL/EutN